MTDHNPDTSKMVPPCPVCGVVPPFDSGANCDPTKLWASCNCITAPDLYEPWKWEHACKRELGWALRAHGIETVAQVDALQSRITELEAELRDLLARRGGV
jgi:hypothetical protein